MNLRQLLELTTLVSAASPHLIESNQPLPQGPLQRIWNSARARQRGWLNTLAAYPQDVAAASPQRRALWDRASTVLSDVFIADVTIRLWAAVMSAHDVSTWTGGSQSFARQLFLQQLEARQHALRLMVDAPYVTLSQLAEVDRLRRKLERWSDLLVGHLVKRYGLDDFAFDLDRAHDFGDEQLRDSWGLHPHRVWDLYLVCLRSSFPDIPLRSPIYAGLHRETLSAMFACFPSAAFADEGPLRSVRLRRLLAPGPISDAPQNRPLSARPRK